ncbi:hypothetical protein GTA08_BOTSDO01907 [Botryosphaeria dothidea]|uniref:Ankyrin repeat protein n=1 Tax=Botryosphaeria dothidea TaxID=55169 RepID=A0A8H4IZ98_9PEZI|nr:hypothetical protein GTA08_BOTSDO14100 [Botryosphaeria dothidea]KAF4309263.1 hypothetical protein GTA08_BOTSDO01907 [Botryosphaeria dothidea]
MTETSFDLKDKEDEHYSENVEQPGLDKAGLHCKSSKACESFSPTVHPSTPETAGAGARYTPQPISTFQKCAASLVQHGTDVEASAEHNILPLHLAVNRNHSCSCSDTTRGEVLDCLLPLMSPSALSNAQKPTTYCSELYPSGVQATALPGAINSRFYRAAETLHQHGAALGNARSISRRFAEVVCWRNDDVVASLLRYGADPTHLPDAPARPLLLVAARATSTLRTRALHAALENRECVGAVEVLLAHGADVSRRDKEGRTALDKARMAGLEDVMALLEEELKKL